MDIYHRLLEILADEMARAGLQRDQAVERSVQVVSRMSAEVGGRRLYFPKQQPWISKAARDQRLRERFDGRNVAQLAREFRMSERNVRRIVKK